MTGPAVAHHFHLDIAPLFQGLQVLSFTGTEAISEPFAFELEVLIDQPDLDAQSLMYRAAFLSFKGGAAGVHGQIHSVMRSHFRPGPACYQLSLGPRLACLSQRYNPRFFQSMSVPQIVSQVLAEHGIRADSYCFDLKNEYPKREYCAQYRETDLQLVQRLCAEEGIHYHFHHSPKRHQLVFGDGLRVFRRTSVATVQQAPMQVGVSRFALAQGESEQPEGVRQRGEGESTLPFVSSGHLLPLVGHVDDSLNHLWLVTEVTHRGLDHRQLRSIKAHQAGLYTNQFNVAPWESGFKPQPRPRASAATLQSAYVLGSPDEPVRRDSQWRVRVLLDWGYSGEGVAHADCWMPVDRQFDVVLRGGMQVVVSFIEGDLDRPIISACLWQAADLLPEPPQACAPAQKLEVHLGSHTEQDAERWVQIERGARISYEPGCELSFTVGESTVTIDDTGVKLSSPNILLATPDVMADEQP